MIMKDDFFKRFTIERGLSDTSITNYKTVLNQYCEFHKKSLSELILEAEAEEEKGVRWKNRTLKKRLLEYRNYLYTKTNLKDTTIKTKMIIIKIFYNHFEIEIGHIQKYTSKNVRKSKPQTAEDIPTVAIVRKAVELSYNKTIRACIHFMSATGLARVDALNLKVEDFVRACEGYFNAYALEDILKEIANSDEVVGKFRLKRQKTGKWQYAFCTPESAKTVAEYLLSRENLEFDSKLFKVSVKTYTNEFKRLNIAMGYSKDEDGKWWLRGHKLRKFQAKQLFDDGMSIADIDAIQGRGKDKTHEAYFVNDPKVLKEKYMQHMHKLMLFSEVEYKSIESEEYLELKRDNDALRRENEEYKNKINSELKLMTNKQEEYDENQKRIRELLNIKE